MNENAEKLKELFKKKSAEAGKVSELEELRIEFLGKKGHIANLMSELRALPNDQKKEAGQKINTIKQFIETSMQERLQELKALEEQRLGLRRVFPLRHEPRLLQPDNARSARG